MEVKLLREVLVGMLATLDEGNQPVHHPKLEVASGNYMCER